MSALPIVTAPANPHLQRFGGPEAVARLVDAFYEAMDTLPEARTIRAMHASDLTATKAVLVDYLVEWMGGAKRYSAERGAPMLRRRHLPFPIDASARDAWLACMHEALAQHCADAALRAHLQASFAKVAAHLANTN